MTYQKKMSLLIVVDIFIVWLSTYISYLFRFDGLIPPNFTMQCIWYMIITSVVTAGVMRYFRLYNRVWQYASIGEMIVLFKAVTVSNVTSFAILYMISFQRVPLSIFILNYETILLLIGGSRFVWRVLRDRLFAMTTVNNQPKALIIGAGDCGALIAKEMLHSQQATAYPVAYIDDDVLKHNQQIHGLPVLGGRERIVEIIEKKEIEEIIIAIPSLSKREVSEIIDSCKQTKVKMKIIPRINDLINGKVSLKEIRDVDVEDLLGRDPVKVDLEGIANYVENKTVLITGAGGSIGSELCRQIGPFKPRTLVLLGHGENSIYAIEMELRRLYPSVNLETVIADVQDRQRIMEVFNQFKPNVVFHAAAHKHVPLMERNPAEAIKNNVFGTKNVADAANIYGVDRFVLISTDKAVNPTSIMGATKRIAEMYIQSLSVGSRTKFAAVRFGNVLGSRGSVIPYFKEQIVYGGPVTVTHPDMIRYFMTIPEAVQLVIQAGSFAQGGEIFILDMGQPVSILKLAEDLIRLSGMEPYHDIDIKFSGIRPGEKLYEELFTSEEGVKATLHDRIHIAKPPSINKTKLEFEIKKLEKTLTDDQDLLQECLRHIVPSFLNVS